MYAEEIPINYWRSDQVLPRNMQPINKWSTFSSLLQSLKQKLWV